MKAVRESDIINGGIKSESEDWYDSIHSKCSGSGDRKAAGITAVGILSFHFFKDGVRN